MNQKLLALYGLKWNPFSPELPVEAIYVPPKIESFCWRIEHAQRDKVKSNGMDAHFPKRHLSAKVVGIRIWLCLNRQSLPDSISSISVFMSAP